MSTLVWIAPLLALDLATGDAAPLHDVTGLDLVRTEALRPIASG